MGNDEDFPKVRGRKQSSVVGKCIAAQGSSGTEGTGSSDFSPTSKITSPSAIHSELFKIKMSGSQGKGSIYPEAYPRVGQKSTSGGENGNKSTNSIGLGTSQTFQNSQESTKNVKMPIPFVLKTEPVVVITVSDSEVEDSLTPRISKVESLSIRSKRHSRYIQTDRRPLVSNESASKRTKDQDLGTEAVKSDDRDDRESRHGSRSSSANEAENPPQKHVHFRKKRASRLAYEPRSRSPSTDSRHHSHGRKDERYEKSRSLRYDGRRSSSTEERRRRRSRSSSVSNSRRRSRPNSVSDSRRRASRFVRRSRSRSLERKCRKDRSHDLHGYNRRHEREISSDSDNNYSRRRKFEGYPRRRYHSPEKYSNRSVSPAMGYSARHQRQHEVREKSPIHRIRQDLDNDSLGYPNFQGHRNSETSDQNRSNSPTITTIPRYPPGHILDGSEHDNNPNQNGSNPNLRAYDYPYNMGRNRRPSRIGSATLPAPCVAPLGNEDLVNLIDSRLKTVLGRVTVGPSPSPSTIGSPRSSVAASAVTSVEDFLTASSNLYQQNLPETDASSAYVDLRRKFIAELDRIELEEIKKYGVSRFKAHGHFDKIRHQILDGAEKLEQWTNLQNSVSTSIDTILDSGALPADNQRATRQLLIDQVSLATNFSQESANLVDSVLASTPLLNDPNSEYKQNIAECANQTLAARRRSKSKASKTIVLENGNQNNEVNNNFATEPIPYLLQMQNASHVHHYQLGTKTSGIENHHMPLNSLLPGATTNESNNVPQNIQVVFESSFYNCLPNSPSRTTVQFHDVHVDVVEGNPSSMDGVVDIPVISTEKSQRKSDDNSQTVSQDSQKKSGRTTKKLKKEDDKGDLNKSGEKLPPKKQKKLKSPLDRSWSPPPMKVKRLEPSKDQEIRRSERLFVQKSKEYSGKQMEVSVSSSKPDPPVAAIPDSQAEKENNKEGSKVSKISLVRKNTITKSCSMEPSTAKSEILSTPESNASQNNGLTTTFDSTEPIINQTTDEHTPDTAKPNIPMVKLMYCERTSPENRTTYEVVRSEIPEFARNNQKSAQIQGSQTVKSYPEPPTATPSPHEGSISYKPYYYKKPHSSERPINAVKGASSAPPVSQSNSSASQKNAVNIDLEPSSARKVAAMGVPKKVGLTATSSATATTEVSEKNVATVAPQTSVAGIPRPINARTFLQTMTSLMVPSASKTSGVSLSKSTSQPPVPSKSRCKTSKTKVSPKSSEPKKPAKSSKSAKLILPSSKSLVQLLPTNVRPTKLKSPVTGDSTDSIAKANQSNVDPDLSPKLSCPESSSIGTNNSHVEEQVGPINLSMGNSIQSDSHCFKHPPAPATPNKFFRSKKPSCIQK